MAAKLHELLAVEKDRKGTAQKIIFETTETFVKKNAHFDGFSRTYDPKTEDPEMFDAEQSRVVTTVPEKLSYFQKHIATLFDVLLQKELSNSSAKADIVVKDEATDEDTVLAKAVPVQALVQLENYLEQVRSSVYDTIPTLDPKFDWEQDEKAGTGYWKTSETRKRKTKKIQDFVVVVPTTPEHPAIVKEITKDVYTGDWVERHFSGRISPARKSELLGNISRLIEAVKKARARANNIDVLNGHLGQRLFQFIENGK